MIGENLNILLVDDDDVDLMSVRRSFRDLQIDNPVVEARDGIEALACLRGEQGFAPVKPPFLILLDLNMPRMGGIEFLHELRADPALRRSLVFVMSTSAADSDVRQVYEKNVAGYILKHRQGQSFKDSIGILSRYWKGIELPV
jgi:CheY-like chemotaxis protein